MPRLMNKESVEGAMSERKLIEPGTPLAYSEELLPGRNTFDDGTQIRAAAYGVEHIDPKTMAVSIKNAGKGVATIEKGDVVVGLVTFIKPEALASVKILAVRGKEGRSLLQSVDGTLHVSKIDARYIANVDDELRCGDYIRAKVIGLKGGPQLATDRPELGVVRAFGPSGSQLEMRDGKLRDPDSGQSFYRKAASDYGSGIL